MPEINGQLCECLSQDPSTGRWLVKLEDGRSLKLKPENLNIFSQDDNAGASTSQAQQVAQRPKREDEFEPSITMFLPEITPKRALFVGVWILGVLTMLYAPAPIESTPEAQDEYEHLLAKAGTMRSAIEAENELMMARRDLYDAQGVTFLWRLSSDSRQKVAEKQRVVDYRQGVYDKHNAERQALIRKAKSTVGLWSEYGLDEVRATFWKAMDDGKNFAKRMSWWDAMFFGIGAVSGSRRDQDAHIILVILKFIGQILMNFTIAFVFAFFSYTWSLISLVLSYEPDAFTGSVFFAVAFLAAFSMVAAVIFCMYAGTAATIGGVAYIAHKSRQAQLEGGGRRQPQQLRGGQRRPHYD